jgi:hypothetical protein
LGPGLSSDGWLAARTLKAVSAKLGRADDLNTLTSLKARPLVQPIHFD